MLRRDVALPANIAAATEQITAITYLLNRSAPARYRCSGVSRKKSDTPFLDI
jgi:hypothetical protein